MWTIEELKSELNHRQNQGELNQWQIRTSQLEKREFYLIREKGKPRPGIDQTRSVEKSDFFVKVFTPKEENKQGSAEAQVFPNLSLAEQLNKIIESAKIAEQQKWGFLENPEAKVNGPETSYAPFQENFEEQSQFIYDSMMDAISKSNGAKFNSSEIFVSKHNHKTILSNGFENKSSYSKIYGEVCYSSEDDGQSDEYMVTRWGAHPEQLNFNEICDESAKNSQSILKTEKTPTGQFSVLLSADVVNQLVHDALSHLYASQKYFNMPFIEKEKEFIPDFQGEAFSIELDPEMDFGFESGSFSSQGALQKKSLLVSENQVLYNPTSVQMSQYLDWPVTTTMGNVKINTQGCPVAELIQSEDQVIEILQFSGLFTNPLDLTFSSEIRLAKLYDNKNKTVQFIRGGNLSGHFPSQFKSVKWSKETTLQNHFEFGQAALGYHGPKYALVGQVSISS